MSDRSYPESGSEPAPESEMNSYSHIPVLLQEVLAALLKSGNANPAGKLPAGQTAVNLKGCFVDATFGRGGHSRALLSQLHAEATLLVMDRDPQAIAAAAALQQEDARVVVASGGFAELGEKLFQLGIQGVNGVLMDLGVSSPQLDDPARGFSFARSGPLDMRMDTHQVLSAASWLNEADEVEIADVIYRYGEERHSRRIARQIVQARPLTTTMDLADAVLRAMPGNKRSEKHPATRTFQAVRMFVNNESEQLEQGLAAAFEALLPGARLAVISFHSLEDRLVKQTFRKWSRPAALPRRLPVRTLTEQMPGREIGRGTRPGAQELADNPRARSATLRVIEKLELAA